MEVQDKTLAFDRDLWVQYGGVDVSEDGRRIRVTGRDDESYLKVFNHFGRVLKLYVFEGGRWIDADTGAAPQRLDESQAGHLAAATGGKPAASKPAADQRTGTQRATKAAPRKKAAAKPTPGKAAKRKSPAGKAPAARTASRGKGA